MSPSPVRRPLGERNPWKRACVRNEEHIAWKREECGPAEIEFLKLDFGCRDAIYFKMHTWSLSIASTKDQVLFATWGEGGD